MKSLAIGIIRFYHTNNKLLFDNSLLIGSVKIVDLYMFLKAFSAQTNNLDLIYEKNVRKFLGAKQSECRILETLDDTPELFSLYNSRITIVVEDF